MLHFSANIYALFKYLNKEVVFLFYMDYLLSELAAAFDFRRRIAAFKYFTNQCIDFETNQVMDVFKRTFLYE